MRGPAMTGGKALRLRRLRLPASKVEFTRINPDGLHRARPAIRKRHIDRGRNAPICEERQPLDEILVNLHDIRTGWLHPINGTQRERAVKSDTLTGRSHRDLPYAPTFSAQETATWRLASVVPG